MSHSDKCLSEPQSNRATETCQQRFFEEINDGVIAASREIGKIARENPALVAGAAAVAGYCIGSPKIRMAFTELVETTFCRTPAIEDAVATAENSLEVPKFYSPISAVDRTTYNSSLCVDLRDLFSLKPTMATERIAKHIASARENPLEIPNLHPGASFNMHDFNPAERALKELPSLASMSERTSMYNGIKTFDKDNYRRLNTIIQRTSR
jgi:hypothetical protein